MKSYSDDLPNVTRELVEKTLSEAEENRKVSGNVLEEVRRGNRSTDQLLASNEGILGGLTMVITEGQKSRKVIRNLILLNILLVVGNMGVGTAMLLKMLGIW